MKSITVNASTQYNVYIGYNLTDHLPTYLQARSIEQKAVIISDSNVWPIFGNYLSSKLTDCGFNVYNYVFPAGEQSKSLDIYMDIIHYLDEHLTEEINIDDLAEKFYISRFHMMRRFREETGTTIHSYLSDHRLMLARDLIGQGEAATEVCFKCGFGSYSSFSRAYSKFFGTTPTGRMLSSAVMDETYE